MHERGEKSPRFKYRVKINLIISHVIIAYLVQLGAGPPPPRLPVAGGPTLDRGTMQKAHTTILGRAHPLKQKKRGPRLTLYCLIQTVMVLIL